jgi:hypothetical protein
MYDFFTQCSVDENKDSFHLSTDHDSKWQKDYLQLQEKSGDQID